MFTGIIQALCPITSLERQSGFMNFTIELPAQLCSNLKIGASIAINGVCLTVMKIDGSRVSFDVMQETFQKTTIGLFEVGGMVNVERSASMGDEIGGHVMSGHVSTQAEIVKVEESENNKAMEFHIDPVWMRYIFSKGFIGLDGASLTVVDTDKESGTFRVWFIPETLRVTRFGDKSVGDKVNVEIDHTTQAIVETVEAIVKKDL